MHRSKSDAGQPVKWCGGFPGSGLHLLEQADIADGNHRLVGKGLQKGDLLVAERSHFSSTEQDGSDALVLPQQRHAQDRSDTDAARHSLGFGQIVAFGGQHIV
jgi:hypothetical protein